MCQNHSPFVNLHVHTAYSLLDSISKPQDIMNKVKAMGQPAVAITEHGNVFSAVKATKLAKALGVKHIYGCEFYTCDNRFEKNKDRAYYHMTILAKNESGRININKLVSIANIEGFYRKPRIDFELLQQYGEGLIILSGCMASELQQTLAGGKIGDRDVVVTPENYRRAKQVAARYKKLFGDDYYIEVQSHRDHRQQTLNRYLVNIAKELGIKWVATADSHFVEESDMELHGIFVQIGQSREVGETYHDTQLQSEEEARVRLKPALTDEEIDVAISTTMEIMEKCNAKIPLSAPLIPHVEVPEYYNGIKIEDEDDFLQKLCNEGWKKRGIHLKRNQKVLRYKDGSWIHIQGANESGRILLAKYEIEQGNAELVPLTDIYKERLLYEYNAVSKMGFTGYYLMVRSYANSVRRRGIARGSGGGSLIAYLLNIVNIDPVRFNLKFERFIDVAQLELLQNGQITPEELKIPDFDLDFGTEEREKVIQYIVETYGKDRVASIGTFMNMKDKSAVKDVGRVLNIPFNVTNEITKIMDEDSIEECIKDGRLAVFAQKYPKLFEYAQKLSGLPRSFSMHPCGKVITIDELNHYTGLSVNEGELVFHLDMKDCEALGLVKIDTLGLRTVDVEYDTIDMILDDQNLLPILLEWGDAKGINYNVNDRQSLEQLAEKLLDPDYMDFEDPKVLEVFQNGFTDGVFQFESEGMKKTLKEMKPTGIDDLAVANALYRPGSLKYIPNYIARKHGLEKYSYLHPTLKPILEKSFGIIVFQEQLIDIGRMAGLRNPDKLRIATGKKIQSVMDEVRPELLEGLLKMGWTKEQFEQLWADMLEFAKYSFNASHSYAYAIIAFACAYLKTYFPVQFMTALFNSYEGKHDRMDVCYREARRLGVEIKPLSIVHPSATCEVVNGKINYGLTLIKHCNRQIARELKEIGWGYKDFTEMLVAIKEKTSVNARQLQILIKLGFFDLFGKRERLIKVWQLFDKRYKTTHKEKTKVARIAEIREFEHSFDNEIGKALHELSAKEAYDAISETIRNEREYYGYAMTNYCNINENLYMVVGIDTKYTPKITLLNLKYGVEEEVKMKKAFFFKKEIDGSMVETMFVNDIIEVSKFATRAKQTMDASGNWVPTGELDKYIEVAKLKHRMVDKVDE